jgi:peptidase M23-like protein
LPSRGGEAKFNRALQAGLIAVGCSARVQVLFKVFSPGVKNPSQSQGTVTFVRADSYTGGPSTRYWLDSNFLVIQHANGEYTRYDHLAHKSVVVKGGDSVRAGQLIARVGITGFTYLPHLHLQVFVFTGPNVWTDFETLVIDSFMISGDCGDSPMLVGVYMEDHETVAGVNWSYPSPGSYNAVFITAGLLSAVSLGFALMLKRKLGRSTVEA